MSTPQDAAGCLKYFMANCLAGAYTERGNTIAEVNEFWKRILSACIRQGVKLTGIARSKAKELKLGVTK